MLTRIVEVTNGPRNWGKFLLAKFDDEEWNHNSVVDDLTQLPLLRSRGWSRQHIMVCDLETGEGALFLPHKNACAGTDLNKHRIWVCPLFEPFLEWLYLQPDPMVIPSHVDLPDAEFDLYGYRRKGANQ